MHTRAQGANLAAAAGYYACLQSGLLPSAPALASALRAFHELGFDVDVRAAWALALEMGGQRWDGSAKPFGEAGCAAPVSADASSSSASPAADQIRSLARQYAERLVTTTNSSSSSQPPSPAAAAPSSIVSLSGDVVASAAVALGHLGDVAAVAHAYVTYVTSSLLTSSPGSGLSRISASVGRSFIQAFAVAGDLPAAVECARACLVMGARLPEAAFLPLVANVLHPSEVEHAYAALELMAASGVAPSHRTEAELAGMCGVVSRWGLPVPPSLAARASAAAPLPSAHNAALLATAQEGGATSLVPAIGSTASSLSSSSPQAAASAAALSTVLARFSVFAGNSSLGGEVVQALRSKLFPQQAQQLQQQQQQRATNPLVAAVESARSLCAAIIRWTVQHMQAQAEAAKATAATATPSARAPSSAAGGDTAAAAAASLGVGTDEAEEEGLTLSREMLLLALREWPTSQQTYEARHSLAEASVPRAKVQARMRRLGDDSPQQRAEGDAKVAPYATFEELLTSSRSYGQYLARVRQPRAPQDVWAAAALAREHGGRRQWLPSHAFGPFKFFSHMNPDEDGSGHAGAKPLLRSTHGYWSPPVGLEMGYADAVAAVTSSGAAGGEWERELTAVKKAAAASGPPLRPLAKARGSGPSSSLPDEIDPSLFGIPSWDAPLTSPAVMDAVGLRISGSQQAEEEEEEDDSKELEAVIAEAFVAPSGANRDGIVASARANDSDDDSFGGDIDDDDSDVDDGGVTSADLARIALRYKLRYSLRTSLRDGPALGAASSREMTGDRRPGPLTAAVDWEAVLAGATRAQLTDVDNKGRLA